jgi:hypothetical protein
MPHPKLAISVFCLIFFSLVTCAQSSSSPIDSDAAAAPPAEPTYWAKAPMVDDPSFIGEVLFAQNNPPTPSKSSEPTLGDLGFPTDQTQGNAQDQARLDKRSHMLKMHQRLGLITIIPLAATFLTSGLAGGRSTSSTGRDLHAALGGVATGFYFATAYYSIYAPKIAGTATRGPIRWHKALAFIHGPGMILTPILGVIAFDQKSKGERVHGIASAHGAIAAITGIAYGAAIVSVSFKF